MSKYDFVFSVCEYQLDLAFIMDSSYTIGSDSDWRTVKQFVLDLTSTFPVIGPTGILVSCSIVNIYVSTAVVMFR